MANQRQESVKNTGRNKRADVPAAKVSPVLIGPHLEPGFHYATAAYDSLNCVSEIVDLRRERVNAAAERQFWLAAQSTSVSTVWGDHDDQLFALRIRPS